MMKEWQIDIITEMYYNGKITKETFERIISLYVEQLAREADK